MAVNGKSKERRKNFENKELGLNERGRRFETAQYITYKLILNNIIGI